MSTGFDVGQDYSTAEDEGIVVHILRPDETPAMWSNGDGAMKPVTIRVAGSYSRLCQQFDETLRHRKLKPSNLTLQSAYEDGIRRAAVCTLGWEGFTENGAPLEFSRDNAVRLYRKHGYVLDQVVEAMNDHAGFSNRSSKER